MRMSFCCCLFLFHLRSQASVMGSLHAFPAVCHSSVCQCGGGYHCVLLTTSRAQYKHITSKGFPASMLPGSWTMRPNPFRRRSPVPAIQKWQAASRPSGVKKAPISPIWSITALLTHILCSFQSPQGQLQDGWLTDEHCVPGPK